MRIDPHTHTSWKDELFDFTWGGHEGIRILGVHPHLYGVSVSPYLPHLQLLARGDPELPLDYVYSRHHLGYRVLHLDPAVHLHEVEVPFLVHQELYRSGSLVAYLSAELDHRLLYLLPFALLNRHAGSLFDQLLMSPLDGTLPLSQDHHVPVRVCKNLKLHMFRVYYELLYINPAVSEGNLGLLNGYGELLPELLLVEHYPYTPSSSPCRGLQDHRVAYLPRHIEGLLHIRCPVASGHQGQTHPLGYLFGLYLVPYQLQGGRGRAYELYPTLLDDLRELGVLGKEAVARIDRIGPRDLHS